MLAIGLTAISGLRRRVSRAQREFAHFCPVALLVCSGLIFATAGCSNNTRPQVRVQPPAFARPLAAAQAVPIDRYSAKTGSSSSERLFSEADVIPKGGGHLKLGVPYKIANRWYVPADEPGYDKAGLASWYGADFHGRKTANGEVFDMYALTAAHPTLPLPSYAYVTSTTTGRTVLVRINDRGPYAHHRIMDLSRRTAEVLGIAAAGVSEVRVKYAGRAPLSGDDSHERRFLASQPWAQNLAQMSPPMTRLPIQRRMGLLHD
jgi:rare lipoprotein A (peptidoglycan hydrolase)